ISTASSTMEGVRMIDGGGCQAMIVVKASISLSLGELWNQNCGSQEAQCRQEKALESGFGHNNVALLDFYFYLTHPSSILEQFSGLLGGGRVFNQRLALTLIATVRTIRN
ncbi:hypothetical protein A2U01_0009872, partial [Trifolium medium]|nr:hypothetical protein [Trifolium medium]